uniref:Uncharacterized protein LOC103931360 isoform X3 n=1 Tax=Rhizophora mucronata TaxID=61149 RepID=A0A2P2LHK5_RHIMU
MMFRKPAELLEIKMVLKDWIPVIRRYSGGGTVIVDQGTIFVSFICGKDAVPGLTLYPHPIMTWSGGLYNEVFKGVGDFCLRENDYVFGDHKIGGNAQSITKSRWVHHTSFLWDFKFANMSYLKLPKQIPKYRLARNHLDFICCIKDYMSRSDFIERTVQATGSQFTLQSAGLEAVEAQSNTKFSPMSKILTRQDLQAALVPA